jgi:hypothetical protein
MVGTSRGFRSDFALSGAVPLEAGVAEAEAGADVEAFGVAMFWSPFPLFVSCERVNHSHTRAAVNMFFKISFADIYTVRNVEYPLTFSWTLTLDPYTVGLSVGSLSDGPRT